MRMLLIYYYYLETTFSEKFVLPSASAFKATATRNAPSWRFQVLKIENYYEPMVNFFL